MSEANQLISGIAPILAVRGIRKAFDATAVLHGIDLAVAPGEILALVGENGAGKSTLLNIVSGALAPDGGTIALDGMERRWSGPRAALEAGIALVHQELSVIRSLSVADNIFLGDYCAGRFGFVDRAAMHARARRLLAEVGAAHIRPGARMDRLGIADQQLVEIAKALSREVRLLILDEPTSALTPHEVAALFTVMRALRARGVAVVFISHRLEEVFAIADRVLVLRDGRLVSERAAGAATRENVIADMTGRARLDAAVSPPPPSQPKVVLSVQDLADGATVGPVSFELRAGEVLGVFGLVGAGRSELLELLAGLRRPRAGSAVLPDGGGLPANAREAWARRVAILPEDRKLAGIAPHLSILENLLLSVRQLGPGWLSPARERRAAAPLLQRLGVRGVRPERPVRALSGGNQQKVILARCLAVEPRLLLLDEPTRGIDVRTKAQIYEIIAGLAAAGLAVVFVSSELPEILALASSVLVLARGRQTLHVPNRGLSEARVLQAAFAVD